MLGQHLRYVAHNAGPVIAHQLHADGLPGTGLLNAAFSNHDPNAFCGQTVQRLDHLVVGFGWHAHAQNSGKLPSHTRHATFEPIPAMIGDTPCNTFHLACFVRGKDRNHKMVHGGTLV